MSIIKKPHDKFFKETLNDLETTRDFMKNYLPKDILEIIDLEKLSAEKDSYIDQELQELFSDLLFKTNINGREGYIYFLFEHKSYLSKRTALQLLKYMVKIWEQKITETRKLPIIIPLVVYHGESRWNIDKSLGGMIQGIETLPESIKPQIPDYEYIVYDLSPYGDEEIKGSAKLRIFLELLRSIFNKDSNEFIESLKKAMVTLEELEYQEKGIEYFETFIRYIMNARKDLSLAVVYDVVKEISGERSEVIMTIAEQLIKEGMEKGMEKGLEKGIIEGQRKTAKNLLKLGLTIEQVSEAAELSVEEVAELKKEVALS